MSTTYQDIETAAMNRISANWTTTNIDWPGVPFEPKKDAYIQPRMVWGDAKGFTGGNQGLNFVRGALHINVFVPQGTGSHAANQYVDTLRNLFPRGLKLGSGSRKIVFAVPSVAPPLEDKIWYQVPIECSFWKIEEN